MKTRFLPYNKKLIPRAKELRKNMTKEERKLWFDFLKTNHSLKWVTQKVIENYIVDFYSSEVKLIIEIDGSHHYTDDGIEYDKVRTTLLEGFGLKVIRFTNIDINKNFHGVCLKIDKVVMELSNN